MKTLQLTTLLLLLVGGIAALGCQQDTAPAKAGANGSSAGKTASDKHSADDSSIDEDGQVTQAVADSTPNSTERAEKQASAVTPITPDKLEPAEMPTVALSEAHASICLAKVGDDLPDAALKSLDGKSQQLSELLGKKLTVLTFWTGNDRYALEELEDLSRLVAAPYSGYGVNVLGVNTQDSAEDARQTTSKREVVFPILLDEGGKLLAQLSSERLPRTYLIDANGKILWLDLEYSRTTRRDLLAAIRSQLVSQ